MKTFIGLSGVIPCPTNQRVVIKTLHTDVNDSSVKDVGITLSGVNSGVAKSFNGITPLRLDLQYPFQQPVAVSCSGSVRNVLVGYVHAGSMREHMNIQDPRNIRPTPWRFR